MDEELDQECQVEFEFENFVDDTKSIAKHYIDLFFWDKQLPDGSPIPKSSLYDDSNIDRVMNTSVCNGVDIIYKMIDGQYSQKSRSGQIPDDVKYITSLMQDCSKARIPKAFASGVVIMYLNLCKGYKLCETH